MPVVKLYRHGITMGVAPMINNHPRAKRDVVVGWSAGAARRNLQFLYSIDERDLFGEGFAITMTVRDCPSSPDEWHYAIKQFFMYLRRLFGEVGYTLLRYHYVIEWQRRGVPHLHGVIYFPEGVGRRVDVRSFVVGCWQAYFSAWGVSERAQHVKPITGAVGWFQYLSKHAARGIRHYQRSAANIPHGWRTGTGRMWVRGGDWPIKEPQRVEMPNRPFHILRRWGRGWRLADARQELRAALGDSRMDRASVKRKVALARIVSARGCLRCPDRSLSRVRGNSEWMPDRISRPMIERLARDGYRIEQGEC